MAKKKPETKNKSKKVTIAKGVKISAKKAAERRKKPGMSNLGEYPKVKPSDFAGPDGTYPINTRKRAIAALAYARNASNPEAIRRAVYKKYPDLNPNKK